MQGSLRAPWLRLEAVPTTEGSPTWYQCPHGRHLHPGQDRRHGRHRFLRRKRANQPAFQSPSMSATIATALPASQHEGCPGSSLIWPIAATPWRRWSRAVSAARS
jgi:hypothetical protein